MLHRVDRLLQSQWEGAAAAEGCGGERAFKPCSACCVSLPPPCSHLQLDLNKARQAAEAERAARQDAAAAVSLGCMPWALGARLLQLAAGMHCGLLLLPVPAGPCRAPAAPCQPSS